MMYEARLRSSAVAASRHDCQARCQSTYFKMNRVPPTIHPRIQQRTMAFGSLADLAGRDKAAQVRNVGEPAFVWGATVATPKWRLRIAVLAALCGVDRLIPQQRVSAVGYSLPT
jgi:hypothetical protein